MKHLVYVILGVLSLVNGARHRLPAYLKRYAEGPNVCVVQQAYGTGNKYFTSCFGGKAMRMICERPTFVNFHCCSGYHKIRGEKGCTGVSPVQDIVKTVHSLGQREFNNYARQANMLDQLSTGGAYTVFVPNNRAFREAPQDAKQSLVPQNSADESTLLYHVVPGRINIGDMRRGDYEHSTLYKDEKIRINKYAFGVTTVNCARIERPDELATNGIVHVIDGVLKPLETEGTLAEKIFSDDDYSQFQLALFTSEMANDLRRQDVEYTVLAPNNKAFARLPSELLDSILTDTDTAKKVLEKHVIKGVNCKDAVVIAMGVKSLDGSMMMMKCKRDGVYFGGAKVVDGDISASNGVLHGVDKVIIPQSVKEVAEVARELKLNTLMDLANQAKVTDRLTGKKEVTLLAPTDSAFKKLPSEYLAALRTQPLAMEKLMDYHTMKGKITSDKLVGDQDINTNLGLSAKIKISIYRGGVAINNAKVLDKDRVCGNGVIHKIDTVLMPPEDTLMGQVMADPELSTLRQAVETAGLSQLLSTPVQLTLLAPTNRAFDSMSQRNLDRLLTNPDRLKKFLERHIVNRMVVKCAIPKKHSVYTIKSRQGDKIDFSRDYRNDIMVNKRKRVKPVEQMATNGVMYKIDDVLKCSCEPRIR
ncbi:transforming growth factor-beta-induced protein ig-h3-like [Haliotis cracherodii]|uniref:transforming growth factor-beta-induced protein ig-h3-like n=1 Tax=Haliotis cracherodii TaxID=6455 RepID=UPI0039EB759E